MSNCSICSTELKFLNTPTFGSGKLNDGGIVCTSCFKRINKANPKVALKLKNHSLQDIQMLFEEKNQSDNANNSRLSEIKTQIQALGLDNISNFLGRREINELPEILSQNESVDNLIQGTFNNGQGILVSTNYRLIFVDKGMVYGLKVEDFPLDKITSIQYETGLIFGKVKIHTSSNIAEIDNLDKNSARKFAEFVRAKLSEPKSYDKPNVSNEPNVLDQIEKLAKLKDLGILSEEEFSEQKKKLLEKL